MPHLSHSFSLPPPVGPQIHLNGDTVNKKAHHWKHTIFLRYQLIILHIKVFIYGYSFNINEWKHWEIRWMKKYKTVWKWTQSFFSLKNIKHYSIRFSLILKAEEFPHRRLKLSLSRSLPFKRTIPSLPSLFPLLMTPSHSPPRYPLPPHSPAGNSLIRWCWQTLVLV